MIALVVGTVLALVALAFVLYPIFVEPASERRYTAASGERESAIDALREVEFDRATGKLSEPDYVALRARYTARALDELRVRDSSAGEPRDVVGIGVGGAPRGAPAAIRSCVLHGTRPEPDAEYCSECGAFLVGHCRSCGTPSVESEARFCVECGRALAA